jgi:hypothetical protein
MMTMTAYLKHIWGKLIINRSINFCAYWCESKRRVISSYIARNFLEVEPLLGLRRKSRIGGVGCIAGRETWPLRQQSEKNGFFFY